MKTESKQRRKMGPQDGGAFVVGALTMMFVVVAALLTYQVGMLVDSKIELQNAADSAAYSGASMKAVCVNTVEWIGGCMVYVYNNMLAYSFDTMYFAGATETGNSIDIDNYSQAYSQSSDWIERGHDWLLRLGDMQAAIANATPRMIHNEVVDTATRNGADYVAVWPDYENYEYFVDRADSLNCTFDFTREYNSDSVLIASNTDYVLRVRRNYRASRFFEFALNDPVYASAGVDTGAACSFFIEAVGSVVINDDGISSARQHITGYDGTTFVIEKTNIYGEGEEASIVKYCRMSITGSAPILVEIGEETGVVPVTLYAQVAGVDVWLGYLVYWNGGNPYASLYSMEARIGDTYVLNLPANLSIEGSLNNGSLEADFLISDWTAYIDGFNSAVASPDFVDYGDWRSRLYERSGGYCFEKQMRLGEAFPFFVEDNYARFVNRGVASPSASHIDRHFGRTLQGDEFTVGVHADMRAMITSVPQWDTFGLVSPDYQSVDLTRAPMPLSISDEFLRYGVSVGCYKEPRALIWYRAPEHGLFAVACARLGKNSSTSSPSPDDTLKILHLPSGEVELLDTGYAYVNVSQSDAARRGRVDTSGSQGYWRPVLMPIRTMMADDDLDKDTYWYANSAMMVFDRLINYSFWRAEAFGEIYTEIPDRIRNDFLDPDNGEPLDFSSEDIRNATQH